MESKFCHSCGEQIAKSAPTCPKCGALQAGTVSQTLDSGAPSNKTITVVLALLLGGLGAHKFYLRQYLAGALYILFCWTYLPALISLGEGLRYALMKDETFDAEFNGGQPVNKSGAGLKIFAALCTALIVVAFIGVLAAIAIPAYHDYIRKAKAQGSDAAIDQSAAQGTDVAIDQSTAQDPPDQLPVWSDITSRSPLAATAWQCASDGDVKQLKIFGDGTFVEHFVSGDFDVVTFGTAKLKGDIVALHTSANVFLSAPASVPLQRWIPAARADKVERSNNVTAEFQVVTVNDVQLDMQPLRRVNWDGGSEISDAQLPAWHCTPAQTAIDTGLSTQRQGVPAGLGQ